MHIQISESSHILTMCLFLHYLLLQLTPESETKLNPLKATVIFKNTLLLYHCIQCLCIYFRNKPFRKSAPYEITSGRVHLDLCWIDQSTSLLSGLK